MKKLPLVMMKKIPSLTVDQLVSVQPMTAPTGMKFEERDTSPEQKAELERFFKAIKAVAVFFKEGHGSKYHDSEYQIP